MSAWRAHYEKFPSGGGVLRAGRGAWRYGQPFEVSIAVANVDVDGDEVELKGFASVPEIGLWHAVSGALARAGVTVIWSERVREDGTAQRTRFLARYPRESIGSTGMDNITLLFGDIVAVNGDGKLAYIMGGPKYFGLGAEAHSRMQRIMATAIDETVKIGEEAVAVKATTTTLT